MYVRCRPSRTASGAVDDYGLLVEARSGFCTQLGGHRPGPIFVDVRAAGAGAALLMTTSVFALLRRRALGGAGGWAETSLYDGMLATLGCMIGRSERAAPEVEGYWEKGSTFPNFLYRCADGELLQVWFGGKGMYPKLLDVLGDEPSGEGYYTDQATGALRERAARWRSTFATRPRDEWIARLREAGIAAEPVFGPGEALGDPHVAEVGLASPRSDLGHDDVVLATPMSVRPLVDDPPSDRRRPTARRRRRWSTRVRPTWQPPAGRTSSPGCACSTSRPSSPGPWPPRSSPTSAPRSSRSSRPAARRCGRRPTPSPPASGASAAWPWTSAPPRPVPWSSG